MYDYHNKVIISESILCPKTRLDVTQVILRWVIVINLFDHHLFIYICELIVLILILFSELVDMFNAAALPTTVNSIPMLSGTNFK